MKMTLRKAFLRLMLVGGARGLLQPTAKTLEPRFFKDAQSQRLAITYGNFSVPGMGDHHGMKTFSTTIPPPCSDCFVTHAQADLQYANGTYANVNTGMWLHHVVVFNLNRSGIVCPTIPDIAFACGNERTPANICVNGTQKAGYYIAPGTTFFFKTELMNDKDEARDAAVVIDWEFVPNNATTCFKKADTLWLDIDGACTIRGSEVPVPDNGTAKVFSLSMAPPWKPNFSADILVMGSHLHDGGEWMQTTKNGATVCDSVAKYGESEAYISTSVHDHGGSGIAGRVVVAEDVVSEKETRAPAHTIKTSHVSSISTCSLPKEKIQPGDEWSVTANYNLTDHKAMGDGADLAPIMGITMVYLVKN